VEQAVITAELRQKTSKGENKRLRKEGKIPGVLYGKGKEAASIVLSARQLQQVAAGEGARLLKLQLPGEAERTVLLKDIQYDHLYKNIHHVDLQEISLTEKITVTVPLVLAGEDARENDGGIVQQMLHELEIECLPTNLPEQIAADVSGLAIGDSLTLAELAVDEGIEIKTSPEETVVTVVAPTKVEEVEEEAAEEAPEAESEEEAAEENA